MKLNSTKLNTLIVQYIREVVREELHQQSPKQSPKDWDISNYTDELNDLMHEAINNATITIDRKEN